MYAALGKWVGTGLLTGGLWASIIGAAAAADRTEAKREAMPVPTPMSMAVAPAGLDAVTPLPGGSVPWADVAAPPALGRAGGGALLQGGPAGRRSCATTRSMRWGRCGWCSMRRGRWRAAPTTSRSGRRCRRARRARCHASSTQATNATARWGVDYFGAVGSAHGCSDDGWHFAGFRHGTCASPLPTGPGDTGNQEPGGGGERRPARRLQGLQGIRRDPDTPNPDSAGPGPRPTPPVPDPDPKPDPKRRNCYQTWRFRSLFDSAPSMVQIAVDFVDAASTFSFAIRCLCHGIEERWPGRSR